MSVRYVGILPAENPVKGTAGVNVLLMVDNPGEAVQTVVRFFVSDGGPWREILAEERELEGHTHIHAYFHLPESCFAPEAWGGEKPEELTLSVGEPGQQSLLLFFE